MRFSLLGLTILVVYAAILCAATMRPSATLASAVFSLTLLLLWWAMLVAMFARGQARVFAIGFAVSTSLYLIAVSQLGDALLTTRFINAIQITEPPPNDSTVEAVRQRITTLEQRLEDLRETMVNPYRYLKRIEDELVQQRGVLERWEQGPLWQAAFARTVQCLLATLFGMMGAVLSVRIWTIYHGSATDERGGQ